MPDTMKGAKDSQRDASHAGYETDYSLTEDEALVLRETGQPLSYRDLKVWQLARDLSVEVHRLTLERLPRFELYEEGSQVRRSAKSVRSNIVEGFGRRRYKQDFLKHLIYAEASCDETVDHLDTSLETGSLTDRAVYERVRPRLLELARRLNHFIAAVEAQHESPEVTPRQENCSGRAPVSGLRPPISGIRHPASDLPLA